MEQSSVKEIWKDVVGYEGLYQVSNLGNIKSLDKYVNTKGNKLKLHKGKILKPKKRPRGYLEVSLYKDRKPKSIQIHRLVAIAFIPNPENKPHINHKKPVTEEFCDNSVNNLEWCTPKENMIYAFKCGRVNAKGKDSVSSKTVLQYDLNGNFIREWDCTMDIQRELGFANTDISGCCLGKRKTAYGYKWRYKARALKQ